MLATTPRRQGWGQRVIFPGFEFSSVSWHSWFCVRKGIQPTKKLCHSRQRFSSRTNKARTTDGKPRLILCYPAKHLLRQWWTSYGSAETFLWPWGHHTCIMAMKQSCVLCITLSSSEDDQHHPALLRRFCWLTWVKVLRPTRHKIGHFRDVFQANLLAWYGKTKPNTTKAHIHQSKRMYNNTK